VQGDRRRAECRLIRPGRLFEQLLMIMVPACNWRIVEFLYTWGSVDADKLTSIAGSEGHLCSQGFGREA